MSRLLEGVRVLECGVLLNCDTVGMRLADMGADVIKIEPPPRGDYIRDINGVLAPRLTPVHLHVNRNKRSIALDLRDERGLDVFWRLLDTADVFVDGLTAGSADRLGIGYDAQRARRPSIVYCQYTGFGADGPYSSLPTHGQMMDALAAGRPRTPDADGMLVPYVPPRADGREGGEGTSAGAMHAVTHILAGVIQARTSGEGAYIDVAASDGVVAQAWIEIAMSMNEHRIVDPENLPRRERGAYIGAKYQYYRTADDRVVLFCAIEPRFWEAFCRVVGREDLIEHHDESTPIDFGHDDDLRRDLQSVFATRTQAEWVAVAIEHRIPLGPAPRTLDEMLEDPHVCHRGIVTELQHPVAGPYTCTTEGAIVRDQPFEIRRQAPDYNEHEAEIRAELGLDEALIP